MGKMIPRLLSLKQLLVVSLAINIGLISKLFYEVDYSSNLGGEKQRIYNVWSEKQSRILIVEEDAHVSKTSPSPSLISSAAAATCTESNHGGERVVNLDHGDPTMYEKYWQTMGEKTTIVISGWHSLSYFSDVKNLCWFLEPEFAKQILRIHNVVGNAVTENKYIVVGTGSSQLYQAALYALSPSDASEPMSVVSAAPYYSSYPLMTDYLKSGLYSWAGDANIYDKEGPYIELVTSPNNPDGFTRQAVVNKSRGILIHDFAYYWPQYTPITYAPDHDLMLFTVSKSIGHAGMRIGWALVKDKDVAKKMTKFIELNTIGVSKDSQLRAAKVLEATTDSCENNAGHSKKSETFFDFGFHQMANRWTQLRKAVNQSGLFSLPYFPSAACNFFGSEFKPQPAFAWMKCEGDVEDCESFLKGHKILTRGGKHFGAGAEFVRISMLDRDDNYNRFICRLSAMT